MARALALALVLALASAAPAVAQEPLPPQGPPPPGANDFACKPPQRHPYPVVLVHGTFLNMRDSWNSVAPALTRLGYCVFALDYGNNATGDIPTSARQLSTFVDQVLAATGAAKVAMVGHSQGGMMPRYLIKFLGATNKVDDLVGFSPSNHGTTNPAAGPAGAFGCVACTQQVKDSDFMKTLNSGDETPGPVSYTVAQTRNDEVVTPYDSAFLAPGPAVTNVLLQDACPANAVEHVRIPDDPVAIQWMLAALGTPGPARADFKPDCSGQGLASFPDSSSVAGAGPAAGGEPPFLVVGSHGRPRGKRLRVAIAARRGEVRGTVVSVRTTRGRVLGRSGAAPVTRRRKVFTVRLRRPLRRGTYTFRAQGTDRSGDITSIDSDFTVR
jgi:triacylglycerol lipase